MLFSPLSIMNLPCADSFWTASTRAGSKTPTSVFALLDNWPPSQGRYRRLVALSPDPRPVSLLQSLDFGKCLACCACFRVRKTVMRACLWQQGSL